MVGKHPLNNGAVQSRTNVHASKHEPFFQGLAQEPYTHGPPSPVHSDIRQATRKPAARPDKERVSAILHRCTHHIVEDWLAKVKQSKELNYVSLTDQERTAYLPKLIEDLIVRLRASRSPGEECESICSPAAVAHGQMRKS